MKMTTTTIYPSIPPHTSNISNTPNTILPSSTSTATPILAISRNPVLFGSIFQKIESNGPCSSCGHGK